MGLEKCDHGKMEFWESGTVVKWDFVKSNSRTGYHMDGKTARNYKTNLLFFMPIANQVSIVVFFDIRAAD